METEEIWKDVVGYEGLYLVSNKGRVKSLERGVQNSRCTKAQRVLPEKLMTVKTNERGYQRVCLNKDGKQTGFQAHRVVALAFIPNPENKPEVNHIDFDRSNNNVENLEWVTRRENCIHSIDRSRESSRRNVALARASGNALRKSVAMFDMNNNFLRDFESMADAYFYLKGKRYGFSMIGLHIRKSEKHTHAYGYKWKLK